MDMRIFIGGAGVSIPGSGIGFNMATGAIIDLRKSEGDEPYRLLLSDAGSLGTASGTFALSHVLTEWFPLNVSRHPWLHRKNKLLGRHGQLEIKNTMVANGEVDVVFTVFDAYGHPQKLLERAMLDASGFQLGSTRVRGVLKRWYSDDQFERIKEERIEQWRQLKESEGAQ